MFTNKVLIEDKDNPAFNYLKKEYSANIKDYSDIADVINEASLACAIKIKDEYSIKANNNLIHFFYDLYLTLNSNLFSSNLDVSAIIDGLHLKYFGQPSIKIITSQIQLWGEKERCYLNSFFKISKQNDFPKLLSIFAFYCVSNKPLEATKALELSKTLITMIKIVSPKLKIKIESILNKK